MKTTKTRLFFVLVFGLALLGGGAAGMLAARYPMKQAQQPAPGGASLTQELQLTGPQQDQMRQIWQVMRETATDCYSQAQTIERERQDAYIRLLTDDQKKQYEKIQQDYQDNFTKLQAKRETAFAQAVEATKRLLNDEQRRRYDVILSQRLGKSQSEGIHVEPTTASGIKSSVNSPLQPLASPG